MVYSSSYILARENFSDSAFFIKRQMIYLAIGFLFFLLISKINFNFIFRISPLLIILNSCLLLLTLIPGIGVTVKGASRWVAIVGSRIQPGEFIKFAMVIYASYYFQNLESFSKEKKIFYTSLLFLPLLILLKQPDFGTFSICMAGIFFVAFQSDFSRKKFYTFLVAGAGISIFILLLQPYRIKRLIAFLDPWKNAKTSGFQVVQSFLAFANGSIFGKGLGNGNEKLFYLPEAHNDFIFSVVGEELGFIGVFFTVLAFFFFALIGFKLILNIKNKPAFLVGSGIIFILSLQASFNMAVVLGLLPTKGMNLPFISFGGSSLVANLSAFALFIAIIGSKYSKE